ncbi:MAG TPA: hypothetical protein VMW35_01830 [Myxococcota bacterium]|jgi:hypothetical protein|nr:hypothetical protein [Myxococcota bacterium]
MSEAYDEFCRQIEVCASLTDLQAMGTARILVKEAGLDAKTATAAQLAVVASKLLPRQLEFLGVKRGDGVAAKIGAALSAAAPAAGAKSAPEAVFRRLGGNA